jgi:hypothetical protein
VLPDTVRVVGHDEDGAGLGQEASLDLLFGMSQSKDPLLAEGNGHDGFWFGWSASLSRIHSMTSEIAIAGIWGLPFARM